MAFAPLHDASASADRGSDPRVPQPDPIRGQVASLAATSAAAILTSAAASSAWAWVATDRDSNSWVRLSAACALASTAWSRARAASPRAICAWSSRLSRRNRRSPAATSEPSRMCCSTMVPSMRDRTVTRAIGSIQPMLVRVIGIAIARTGMVITATGGGLFCESEV